MKMKRILICLLITALTCGMTACGNKTTNKPIEPVPPISETGNILDIGENAKPVTPPLADKSYDSLEELSNAIGYTVKYPESLNASSTTYSIKNNSLELLFFNGKVMEGRLIKAGVGNPPATDFYGYATAKAEIKDNINYIIHYTETDACHLITWSEGEFLYLLYTSNIHTIDSIIEVAQQIQ